ncbi:hypothetical protein BrE312_1950 [Brenneria sp. EniD312]|nr:hypothetical protein BrE312_1950 [Brenneria sp. EniD312]
MLNGDNHRGICAKSCGFQPVALEVEAGAAAVIACHIISVCVAADVGGDLLISTAAYDNKNSSAGLNVSICVPPICGGQKVTASGNANLSQQILNNNYASVREQDAYKTYKKSEAVAQAANTGRRERP